MVRWFYEVWWLRAVWLIEAGWSGLGRRRCIGAGNVRMGLTPTFRDVSQDLESRPFMKPLRCWFNLRYLIGMATRIRTTAGLSNAARDTLDNVLNPIW